MLPGTRFRIVEEGLAHVMQSLLRSGWMFVAVACGPEGEALGEGDSGRGSTETGVVSGESSTSSTSSGSGVMSGSTSIDTGGASSSTGAMPFVHEVHTFVTAQGRLALSSNLPPETIDCEALGATDPPCEDADADGLVDVWEDAVLERLRPLRRMDEREALFDDATAVIADVGRVAKLGDRFRLFVMLGYSRDYGSCSVSAHNGDSERVVVDLAAHDEGGPGGVVFVGAYTAAHENSLNDQGRTFVNAQLSSLIIDDDPQTGEPRWVVFPSADKHATYASKEICEGVSFVPCLEEDCHPDGVEDPSAFDLLPPAFNAGEDDARRLDDLGPIGFPGDSAWEDQPFCGGLGGTGCSSAVREKLLVDPF